MRTTINVDSELLTKVQKSPGINSRTDLVREALRLLTERESARGLVRLGGSAPELEGIPRRRDKME